MEIKSAEDRTTTGWNTPTGFSRPLSGGRRGNFKYFCLDFDPFHFVERVPLWCDRKASSSAAIRD